MGLPRQHLYIRGRLASLAYLENSISDGGGKLGVDKIGGGNDVEGRGGLRKDLDVDGLKRGQLPVGIPKREREDIDGGRKFMLATWFAVRGIKMSAKSCRV